MKLYDIAAISAQHDVKRAVHMAKFVDKRPTCAQIRAERRLDVAFMLAQTVRLSDRETDDRPQVEATIAQQYARWAELQRQFEREDRKAFHRRPEPEYYPAPPN